MARPRLFVTNDDGIDSVGLHVLARAMTELGDVTVVAPDREYSGASAAIGAIHVMRPEVHRVQIDGIDTSWSVTGPPGLCMMFARLGTFGPPPVLCVSGINPGANVASSIYHSGTVGATFTARNGDIPGLAVSQSFPEGSVEGQAPPEALGGQLWESAASVALSAARAMLADPPPDAEVLNVNVPNLALDDIKGWRWASVAMAPPRRMARAELVPRPGHEGSYEVDVSWGDSTEQPTGTDTGTVLDDRVSVSWLSRITALQLSTPAVDAALNDLLAR